MSPTYVFSSTYGRGLTVMTALAAVLAVLAVVGDLPLRDVMTAALLGALVTLVVWATLGRPAVEVSDGEIVLVNVTRTVRVPWPLLDRAEARWTLEVHTVDGRRWSAWAAPRSSATGSAIHAARRRADHGERRRSTAEGVKRAIEERHAALLSAGYLDAAPRRAAEAGLRVSVTWHVGIIATTLGLVLAVAATRVL